MADKHVDQLSGIETTGHEWDGIRELDNPLPRWWLWIFYACVVWSIGYYIAYPAIPLVSSYTKGMLGYSSRAEVHKEVAAAKAAQADQLQAIADASLEEIRTKPELLEFAMAGGKSAFNVNCSQCHGSGAQGAPGYPNLNDDEWVWGGSLDAIHTTITHGARNTQSDDARVSQMPAFVKDGIFTREQAGQVAEFVLSLSGNATDQAAANEGQQLFEDNCVACHGEGGVGTAELGAPPLNNDIWLYGGDKATIVESIANSRAGVMPAWGKILDDVTVKQLTIYVHSLGGGQ
ncbi:MAG: cytochrome-c oxidase, cbb3-type subunit III [Rhodospirillales bacterium]|nr:cytochrome-c oxidase, cbb3-type subunit III [Rhodospirillales bacterium]MBO6788462.1 cytochrome-c oxidase, cbb3-type subunit III [Rhodospirillales bacterium]